MEEHTHEQKPLMQFKKVAGTLDIGGRTTIDSVHAPPLRPYDCAFQ